MKLDWHGDRVTAGLRVRLGQGLGQAASDLRDATAEAISTPGPPRSDPFEAPHQDTGDLYETYFHDVDMAALAARVGTDKEYGPHLEYGTATMEPRPHARVTFVALWDDMVHTVFA